MRDHVQPNPGDSGQPPEPSVPHSPAVSEAEALYLDYRPLLLAVASGKFRIPTPDAEMVVHDVVLAWLTAATPVYNRRAWLIAATCNRSRAYWRTRVRNSNVEGTELPEDGGVADQEIVEQLERTLMLSSVLARLSPRLREVLRLRYYEGCTHAEIARRFDTTERYAQKLIGKALRRLRDLYAVSRAARIPADEGGASEET